MARAYDDFLEKEQNMEAASERNGYKKCDNCGTMFVPSAKDPEQFVCDNCIEHAMRD